MLGRRRPLVNQINFSITIACYSYKSDLDLLSWYKFVARVLNISHLVMTFSFAFDIFVFVFFSHESSPFCGTNLLLLFVLTLNMIFRYAFHFHFCPWQWLNEVWVVVV